MNASERVLSADTMMRQPRSGMAAKKSTKREFDWRSYSKPARLLTAEQEDALSGGLLRPLLDLALSCLGVSLEIRARQATLYYRGVSLARITGATEPFSASIDANLRLPRSERPGTEQLETWPLATAEQVSAFVGELAALRTLLDGFAAEEPISARERLTAFAAANRVTPESAELLVVDLEYQYGRRRFDFVAMRRASSVGGPGAFTTPRLVIGELYTGHRFPTAVGGMTSFGADAAEFAHALSQEHLMRAQAELGELAAQRTRLGLLPETPFSHFAEGLPELLVAFTDPRFFESAFDAPLAELHDRLVARHYPTELLRLSAVGEARPESDDASLAVGEDELLHYRAFKGMRKRLQA
jgi:hypothetical protein